MFRMISLQTWMQPVMKDLFWLLLIQVRIIIQFRIEIKSETFQLKAELETK